MPSFVAINFRRTFALYKIWLVKFQASFDVAHSCFTVFCTQANFLYIFAVKEEEEKEETKNLIIKLTQKGIIYTT